MFLSAIEIRSMTSIGGEASPAAPCRKILWLVKDSYCMKEILVRKIQGNFSTRFYCFATRGLYWLPPESYDGYIRNDYKIDGYTQYTSSGRNVRDALCDTTP